MSVQILEGNARVVCDRCSDCGPVVRATGDEARDMEAAREAAEHQPPINGFAWICYQDWEVGDGMDRDRCPAWPDCGVRP